MAALTKGQVVTYGPVIGTVELTAADVWKKLGGYFCTLASGKAAQATAAGNTVFGWVDIGFQDNNDANFASGQLTVPSTTTRYKFNVYGPGSIFYLPASGAVSASTHGLYDLIVTSNAVLADLAASAKDIIIVLPPTAQEIADGWVRCYINPAKYA